MQKKKKEKKPRGVSFSIPHILLTCSCNHGIPTAISTTISLPVVSAGEYQTGFALLCNVCYNTGMDGLILSGYRSLIFLLRDRQFMNEFGKNLEIFFVNDDRTYKRAVLADLLPYAFGPEDLPAK